MNIMRALEQTFVRTHVTEPFSSRDWIAFALIVAAGMFLRFWGLDNVGLHGDEKTTIFPALSVLEQGSPYFPSGMFYGRAMGYTYLVAGSIWLFGETEWAVRLPSALIGSIMPIIAYFLGKRFLSPRLNLGFIALFAFFPPLIELSQEARMYIFWLAAIMVFGVSIFRWEQHKGSKDLILAFLVWLLALHFHRLSVLALPLFLFPGLMNRSWRNLAGGVAAIGVGGITFKAFGTWVGSHYPERSQRPAWDMAEEVRNEASSLQLYWEQYPSIVLLGLAVGIAILAWSGRDFLHKNQSMAFAKLLVGTGVIAGAMLHYHIALFALLFASVAWIRASLRSSYILIGAIAVVIAMGILQTFVLYQTGEYPGRQIIGALVGMPSIWSYIRFGQLSPVASVLYVAVIALAIFKFTFRERVPDHILLFIVAVWIPLLAIGTKTWYPQIRYTAGSLPFFLLCFVAGLSWLVEQVRDRSRFKVPGRKAGTAVALAAVLLVVNPLQVMAVVNSGYERHPDHKGAAEYLQNLPINDDDVIIAEDVMQQFYYLGDVDYWLRTFDNARGYAVEKDGKIIDQYTNVPIISDGDQLIEILDANIGRRVFIVSSGEIAPDRDDWARSRGIGEVLRSDRLEVVYLGRDGITKIWIDGARRTD